MSDTVLILVSVFVLLFGVAAITAGYGFTLGFYSAYRHYLMGDLKVAAKAMNPKRAKAVADYVDKQTIKTAGWRTR